METFKYFTEQVGSDRYPYEVIRKATENKYEVRRMDFKHDFYGERCYDYKSNESRPVETIRRHKDGAFYLANCPYCPFFPTEEPSAYYDPSF